LLLLLSIIMSRLRIAMGGTLIHGVLLDLAHSVLFTLSKHAFLILQDLDEAFLFTSAYAHVQCHGARL
jgi:ABC-type uncharacterized transport system involved in gliding motility auxiliary subunit